MRARPDNQRTLEPVGKADEILNPEALRTQVEHRVGEEGLDLLFAQALLCRHFSDKGFERIAQGLAPLVETRLDYGLEQFLVASEVGAGIPAQADYCGFYLWRRIEGSFAHREQIFYVVPGLQQHRQDAVGLGAGLFGDSFGHFLLYHTHNLGHLFRGGSIRIHEAAMQERMFEILGISKEDADYKFGFIINAFKFGAPPHGGLAFGFDRVCALFGGQETIRDYIAFPKNNQGRDVMIDSPSYIDQEQMDELFLHSTAERK